MKESYMIIYIKLKCTLEKRVCWRI